MSELRDPIRRPNPAHHSPERGRPSAPPLAVFDLDGTLVDTAPDLTASLNDCLQLAGLPSVDVAAVRPHAGMGVRVMLERAYGDAGIDLPADILAEQTARFLVYYEAHIADHSTLYPGAIAAMDRLCAAGFALAICTNKVEALSRRLLAALGIADRFAAVCGSDTFQRRKPDPIHLLGTIERAGGDRQRSVMIGDSRADVDAAFAAGVPSILMGFGYGADAATRAAADQVLASFAEIDAAALRRTLPERSDLD